MLRTPGPADSQADAEHRAILSEELPADDALLGARKSAGSQADAMETEGQAAGLLRASEASAAGQVPPMSGDAAQDHKVAALARASSMASAAGAGAQKEPVAAAEPSNKRTEPMALDAEGQPAAEPAAVATEGVATAAASTGQAELMAVDCEPQAAANCAAEAPAAAAAQKGPAAVATPQTGAARKRKSSAARKNPVANFMAEVVSHLATSRPVSTPWRGVHKLNAVGPWCRCSCAWPG